MGSFLSRCVCVIREESVSFLRTNIATVCNNSLKIICCEGGSFALLANVKLAQSLCPQTHF